MKKALLSFGLLFAFCFSGFGQVDTAAVARGVDSMIELSRVLTEKKDFNKALEVSETAEKLALEKLGRETVAYANVCYNHGVVFQMKMENAEAEKWWLESLAIRKRVLGKENPDYAQSLNNLAIFYTSMGDYEKAMPLNLESISIREKTLGKEHAEYARSLNSQAILYYYLGSYEQAEPLYLEAKAIWGKTSGVEHPDYANSLNNLAVLYKAMGDYEKAEVLYLETKGIREKLGKENSEYARVLNNLALLYQNMGNYEKAETLCLESKAIREKILGKAHPDYAWSLNVLAILYKSMGKYEQAEPLYLEAKAILEEALGKEYSGNYLVINNLATLFKSVGKYGEAEALLLEANANLEKTFGRKHPNYAISLNNLAHLYASMNNYEKAEQFYLEAEAILKIALGEEHPEYLKSLIGLANLHVVTGRPTQAAALYNEAEKLQQALLAKALHHLSERELNKYLLLFSENQARTLSLTQIPAAPNLLITRTAYNNSLFYTGFLLNASCQISNLAHDDSISTVKYNLFKSYHRRLAKQYALPVSDRDSTLVAELETKANDTEKDLAHTVAGFGEALRQVSWQEVQAALQPGEAAIEFIRFDYYNPQPTDSVLYAALLLKPGIESPAFINLFEEKQLEALLEPLAGLGGDGWNELYAGKMGESLHQLLWQPVEAHLDGVKTVYFSPSGLLHRLNLGAIPSGKSATLSDHLELVAMGSTRQLTVANGQQTAAGAETAVIFGGIQYEMDSTAISPAEPEGLANRHRGPSFSQTDSSLRGGTWKYLKYSDKEADNIQSLLQTAGFQTEARKGYAATEEAFKLLGRGRPSPRILHVSTHGFFFPEAPPSPPEGGENAGNSPPSGGLGGPFKASEHPLIRSGLLLAGANYAWQAGQPLGKREDGILTAYEISQMDLRHTELVVLSAYETGLGDIKGNEGVYGLQRAFRIAGAKYLIMSLWQVPDFQTQELMTFFYQKWLEEKMTVRQALKAAQEEMRQKRYEPFYWAGFVLVE